MESDVRIPNMKFDVQIPKREFAGEICQGKQGRRYLECGVRIPNGESIKYMVPELAGELRFMFGSSRHSICAFDGETK